MSSETPFRIINPGINLDDPQIKLADLGLRLSDFRMALSSPGFDLADLIREKVIDAKFYRFCLIQYLNAHPEQNLWEKNVIYEAPPPLGRFKLTRDIIRYARKPGREGSRYLIVENNVGAGGQSTVYQSGTVLQSGVVDDDFVEGVKFKTPQNTRIVKIQNWNLKDIYLREASRYAYGIAPQIPHLHRREVVSLAEGIHALIERKAPGVTLGHLMSHNRDYFRPYSEERMRTTHWGVSFALLHALKNQTVTESGVQIVHRDIKPENIMVHLPELGDSNQVVTAHFIDYDMSIIPEASIVQYAGTSGFMAPETSTTGIATPKSDCFAMGITFLRLWNPSRNPANNPPFNNLVKPLIDKMISQDPESRPTPDEAMRQLAEVYLEANLKDPGLAAAQRILQATAMVAKHQRASTLVPMLQNMLVALTLAHISGSPPIGLDALKVDVASEVSRLKQLCRPILDTLFQSRLGEVLEAVGRAELSRTAASSSSSSSSSSNSYGFFRHDGSAVSDTNPYALKVTTDPKDEPGSSDGPGMSS